MSYRPWRIIWLTTLLTVSTGILKPIPADAPEGLYIAMLQSINGSAGLYLQLKKVYEKNKNKSTLAYFTPINQPRESSKGPPEF